MIVFGLHGKRRCVYHKYEFPTCSSSIPHIPIPYLLFVLQRHTYRWRHAPQAGIKHSLAGTKHTALQPSVPCPSGRRTGDLHAFRGVHFIQPIVEQGDHVSSGCTFHALVVMPDGLLRDRENRANVNPPHTLPSPLFRSYSRFPHGMLDDYFYFTLSEHTLW